MAPWIGRSGVKSWVNAKVRVRSLTDDQKEMVVGGEDRSVGDTIEPSETNYGQPPCTDDEDMVAFDEIYYWRHLYHEDESYYKAIQRMVFVHGVDRACG